MGIEGVHGIEPGRAELTPAPDCLGLGGGRPAGQRGPEPNHPRGEVSKKDPPAPQLLA